MSLKIEDLKHWKCSQYLRNGNMKCCLMGGFSSRRVAKHYSWSIYRYYDGYGKRHHYSIDNNSIVKALKARVLSMGPSIRRAIYIPMPLMLGLRGMIQCFILFGCPCYYTFLWLHIVNVLLLCTVSFRFE